MSSSKWPDYLSNPDTRASHIAIAVVTVIILVMALILLPWAIYRCGGVASSQAETDSLAKYIKSESAYTPIDNQLVDPKSLGTHWIKNGQSILSTGGRFELWLTNEGNLELFDHEQEKFLYKSNTINATTPGQRFLVGIEGLCYIIRNDGSRVVENETHTFWESPNQVQPYFRCGTSGKTFYVSNPFILDFYSDGLVLWSNYYKNKKNLNLKSNRVNLWWISASGILPPDCTEALCNFPYYQCPS